MYKHFGREIIQQLADTDPKSTELIWAEARCCSLRKLLEGCPRVPLQVYDRFIECIDAIDNGAARHHY